MQAPGQFTLEMLYKEALPSLLPNGRKQALLAAKRPFETLFAPEDALHRHPESYADTD